MSIQQITTIISVSTSLGMTVFMLFLIWKMRRSAAASIASQARCAQAEKDYIDALNAATERLNGEGRDPQGPRGLNPQNRTRWH